MDSMIPSYKPLFELTKRRLYRLKQRAINKSGKFDEQDQLMFLIIGNINLRFNTICLLIENNNYDGVFALQRTIFELQLALEAYMSSEDKGYVSEKVKQDYHAIGVDLWTPPKKNQKPSEKVDNSLLSKFRKKVETVISSLSLLGIQQFKSRSLSGFEAHLEAILLTYSFMLEKAQTIIPGTFRYSIGRF
ncbi:hypothetical protein ABE854_11785 [Enterococcus faecium]